MTTPRIPVGGLLEPSYLDSDENRGKLVELRDVQGAPQFSVDEGTGTLSIQYQDDDGVIQDLDFVAPRQAAAPLQYRRIAPNVSGQYVTNESEHSVYFVLGLSNVCLLYTSPSPRDS